MRIKCRALRARARARETDSHRMEGVSSHVASCDEGTSRAPRSRRGAGRGRARGRARGHGRSAGSAGHLGRSADRPRGRPGRTPGTAALGLEHLANRPKPAAVNGTNSDLAFQGDYAFNGNYNGINIYNIADPANPALVTSLSCPGSQNDVSVYGNLLFVSVESTAAKNDCTTTPAADAPRRASAASASSTSPTSRRRSRWPQVQTCRGSHTHTLVRPKNDAANVYIYVSGTAGPRASTELAGCYAAASRRRTDERPSSRWRIEVIKVPLAAPAQAAIVNQPRLFANAQGAHDGLQNGPQTPQHPCASVPRTAAAARARRADRRSDLVADPDHRRLPRHHRLRGSSTSRPAPARATAC